MSGLSSHHIAQNIFAELLPYRRRFPDPILDRQQEEAEVAAIQIPRLQAFIERGETITCVLPAFPTKSPNPNKVLGTLPDMAERLSLSFLNHLCQRIQLHYAPGMRILICSDGHVFGDLIRVADPAIDAYQAHIEQLILELGATHLGVFHLGMVAGMAEFCASRDFDTLREQLVERYAEPLAQITEEVRSTEEGIRLYRAMTRFLYEDSQLPDTPLSNTALQRDAKARTHAVIQRSRAWGNLLAERFPEAIRLSIHPQASHSLKMGIHMLPTRDDWLTPWHGVAANLDGQFVLMKRRDVLAMEHELVHIHGRPSHYLIHSKQAAA
ncbi:isocyanide synthase family protein [Aeromonas hydrophila]|uniref:L-tyrosine/L-tryptophan isonitrile synthase family protein n=1 Tax=Aeromonas hydrophila TaxID=644 RepID=UPI000573DD54|nr:isocyanide synthase family protein [Aeromonas hydrophila]KHN50049.1 paerucumarin biosynthesis protein PvcA [Aeromonas hydrophila]MBL0669348.1 isocyanide synthase family protein [Aeromonas hydrophila]OFC47673.1 paerucumarin biosynthesis protein PvcA [Aeromonas hydrophila]OFC52777.1 paerucumarin biosynthesis protein PvcA [Aeromonas hydrophila]